MLICRLLIFFFKSNFSKKIFHEYHQCVKKLGSRSSALILVQTVFKGSQLRTIAGKVSSNVKCEDISLYTLLDMINISSFFYFGDILEKLLNLEPQ